MKSEDFSFKIGLAVLSCGAVSTIALVTGYVFFESADFLKHTSFLRFLCGTEWDPIGGETFEILLAILGTLTVSALAVLISLPAAIGTGLCLCYYLRGKRKYTVTACIDVIAGIPSVIVGFVGMLTFVRFLEDVGGRAAGESALAAGVALGFMLLPFEISFMTETFDRLKQRYEPAALALGIDALYTLTHIVFPCSKGTVFSAAMLAFARGMGETMAVMMVIGNANLFPRLLGKSLIAGGLTLGIMIFPFLEQRIEKAAGEIDEMLLLSAYSTGFSKRYTIMHIVLPLIKGDIIRAAALYISFAMGATAPIILTAAVLIAPVPARLTDPVMALPYHLYLLVTEGIDMQAAYATALVLLTLALCIN